MGRKLYLSRMTRLWHGFAAMGAIDGNEFVVSRGEGARVWDSAGREYLDASAGLWFVSVGHGRAEIADAAAAQMKKLAAHHCFFDHANEPAIELADRIVEMSPYSDGAVFFGSGGSEAVDTACKLARRYWSAQGKDAKTIIISRQHALPRHERVRHVARRHPGQPRGLRRDDPRDAPRQLGQPGGPRGDARPLRRPRRRLHRRARDRRRRRHRGARRLLARDPRASAPSARSCSSRTRSSAASAGWARTSAACATASSPT